ncbi:hypothetical protein GDO86_010812 [Hymenochirus boettgeri]|uniref:Uncharacterized protein n=1 Tax=Hymenochirus boettgeri TaxID=247094 RepID=A0A8T2JE80_9PIPI|nr:hypothetical protein GDO86_010812 [Hymenochirus boettgeri]
MLCRGSFQTVLDHNMPHYMPHSFIVLHKNNNRVVDPKVFSILVLKILEVVQKLYSLSSLICTQQMCFSSHHFTNMKEFHLLRFKAA